MPRLSLDLRELWRCQPMRGAGTVFFYPLASSTRSPELAHAATLQAPPVFFESLGSLRQLADPKQNLAQTIKRDTPFTQPCIFGERCFPPDAFSSSTRDRTWNHCLEDSCDFHFHHRANWQPVTAELVAEGKRLDTSPRFPRTVDFRAES